MRAFDTWDGKKSRSHNLLLVSSVHVSNGSPQSPWTATILLWILEKKAIARNTAKAYSAAAVFLSCRMKSPIFSLGVGAGVGVGIRDASP